jgi:hypothetical protein
MSCCMYKENHVRQSMSVCVAEIVGTCSTYGGEENCGEGFGWETWRNETTWMTEA